MQRMYLAVCCGVAIKRTLMQYKPIINFHSFPQKEKKYLNNSSHKLCFFSATSMRSICNGAEKEGKPTTGRQTLQPEYRKNEIIGTQKKSHRNPERSKNTLENFTKAFALILSLDNALDNGREKKMNRIRSQQNQTKAKVNDFPFFSLHFNKSTSSNALVGMFCPFIE